jgi:hypothetical protein
MQGEAIEVSTAGAGDHGRWRLGLPPTHVVTGPGTEGHRALHGGAVAGSQQRSLLSQWIDNLPRWLGWGQAPALQQAQGLDPHGQQDIGDVLVGGGGGGVEEGRTAWIRTGVDTVEHEAVEVGVQIERAACPLDDRHCSGAGVDDAILLGLHAKPTEHRAQKEVQDRALELVVEGHAVAEREGKRERVGGAGGRLT